MLNILEVKHLIVRKSLYAFLLQKNKFEKVQKIIKMDSRRRKSGTDVDVIFYYFYLFKSIILLDF